MEDLKEIMLANEKLFSKYACKSEKGIKLYEEEQDIRPIFSRGILTRHRFILL